MTDSYLVSHTVEWNWTVRELQHLMFEYANNICFVSVMLNVHVLFHYPMVSMWLCSHRGSRV